VPILTAEPSSETFPCPNCNEFIAGDSTQCRYCSASIPADLARNAVEAQNKINKACDEAGWLRSLTGAMWGFFFVRWIPFIGFLGWGAMLVTFVAASFWLVYWHIRFARIKTADVDYSRAGRNWNTALLLWLLMLAVFLAPIILLRAR
jgi:hypothetical protein